MKSGLKLERCRQNDRAKKVEPPAGEMPSERPGARSRTSCWSGAVRTATGMKSSLLLYLCRQNGHRQEVGPLAGEMPSERPRA